MILVAFHGQVATLVFGGDDAAAYAAVRTSGLYGGGGHCD
jgi:hypothetical protein